MKNILILCVAVLTFGCKGERENQNEKSNILEAVSFYVGTYTNVKSPVEGGSQGIYHYQISKNGILSKVGLAAPSENPSFLTKSADGKYIIAVNETNTMNGHGTVESYEITEEKLKKISTSSSGGAHPCHISTNEHGQILVSNYSGGNIGLLNISKNGTLSELLDVQKHQGQGSHQRQDAPHAHSSWFRPDGRGVISVDLGTNELWQSEIENNKFRFQNIPKTAMMDGAGPRHLTFHPNGKYLYVLNELDNTIGKLSFQNNGELLVEETISMLPEEYTEANKGADIHISKDGKFLYASNRGHNSIVIYSVDAQSGKLTTIDSVSTKGDGPRNFQLALDDKFLIVANEKSNNIVSFRRDSASGKLTFVSQIDAPAPVCLLF